MQFSSKLFAFFILAIASLCSRNVNGLNIMTPDEAMCSIQVLIRASLEYYGNRANVVSGIGRKPLRNALQSEEVVRGSVEGLSRGVTWKEMFSNDNNRDIYSGSDIQLIPFGILKSFISSASLTSPKAPMVMAHPDTEAEYKDYQKDPDAVTLETAGSFLQGLRKRDIVGYYNLYSYANLLLYLLSYEPEIYPENVGTTDERVIEVAAAPTFGHGIANSFSTPIVHNTEGLDPLAMSQLESKYQRAATFTLFKWFEQQEENAISPEEEINARRACALVNVKTNNAPDIKKYVKSQLTIGKKPKDKTMVELAENARNPDVLNGMTVNEDNKIIVSLIKELLQNSNPTSL